jgi:CelD/BcsL family acetyltransferase involved in cellulose biosynthesis
VHTRILRDIPDDSALREQWNALVFQTRNPQVFYTYEWARAVQLAYGASLCPLLVLGYDEAERLRGVVALAAPPGQPVSFLCANTGDYCDFIADEQHIGDFTSQVLHALRRNGYGDLVLTNFPEDSASYAALPDAARANGLNVHRRMAYLCAQVRLAEITADDGTLTLPRQKMVRRSLRALGSDLPVAVLKQTTWEQVSPTLPEFFRAHIARFLFTERISNLIRPERRTFLTELARLLSAEGWLCISRMSVGSRNIAWNYGFEFLGTSFWYQPTFVNDLEKYSPGFVLLSKLIEDAATDARIHTVDLGLGAETYKEAFANATRRTMYVTLHRSTIKHWKEIARFQIAAAINRRPRLEQTVRNLRAKAIAAQRRIRKRGLPSTLVWVLSRMRRWIASREEVIFFETSLAADPRHDCAIVPVTHELLADAAMQSYEDEETLQYLMRAAMRLRKGKGQSFALIDANGRPVHFAWVAAFEGFFLSELNAIVDAPSANCVMLFDCWTPAASRGRGYYAQAVTQVARLLREQGKSTWIFSADSNVASLRGLAKAGVQQRYALVRKRLLGRQWIEGTTPRLNEAPGAEVSAQV